MFLKNTVFRLWCKFCQFFLTVLTVLKKPESINAKSFLGWWLMMLYQKIEKRKSFKIFNFSISLPHYMWFIKKCLHRRQTGVFSFNFVRSNFCGVPPPQKKEKVVKFTLEEHSDKIGLKEIHWRQTTQIDGALIKPTLQFVKKKKRKK